ncbi:MAG: right-handed parallel beta-helix repeat-containing protein [Myxococcales bacterium]|nr:right-handed parallel beta-helix repeat-containing protein [Myxococcales bacterium]
MARVCPRRALAAIVLVSAAASCGGDDSEDQLPDPEDQLPEGCDQLVEPSADDQTAVQTALIVAAEGSTVCLAEGEFRFTTELSIDVDGVTLRGAGMDLTILDFSGQEVGSGGNGIKGSSDGLTFEDFQVRDTPGDGIRVDDAQDVTFRRVEVAWTAEQSETSGAYGLYPVGCDGVLIEQCVVHGARDAGVYVGQSNDIVVQDNEAWGNVAGIEIENSNGAEVRRNHAHDNTAGILVFNLPGLSQYGAGALVHDNLVENNNVPNFGVAGTIVANVPGGSGMIILACDDNELRDNTVRGNVTAGLIVFTYLPGLFGTYDDPNFDREATGNWVHGNTWEENGTAPIGALHRVVPSGVFPTPSPDIVFDGCATRDGDAPTNCVEEPNATFIDLDFCGGFDAASTDAAGYACSGEAIEARP